MVLGGLGLFIYGMKVLTAGLQAMAGTRLREILSRLTRNRLTGFLAGTLLGFTVHSGAGSVMMVGFINAGLLTLAASIPVMLGNNVGTTLSMQLFAFKVGEYCWFAIGIGLFLNVLGRRERLRHAGLMILGFGLLFLGMNTVSSAVAPLKTAGYFDAILANTDGSTVSGMVVGILASMLITAVLQSSGAFIGMLFALASAGVFDGIHNVYPLILGAHVGTCVVAVYASVGTSIVARRSAISHLAFNFFGAILAALMSKLYLWVIPEIGGDMVRQIANTHTMVQFVNSVIVLVSPAAFAFVVTKMTPSREPPPQKSHLDERYLETPETAVVAVIQELRRMGTLVRRMFRQSMHCVIEPIERLEREVQLEESAVDLLKDSIGDYLVRLGRRELSRRQSVILQYLMRAVADMERIGDHAESILEVARDKHANSIRFDDESMRLLMDAYVQADHVLELVVQSLDPTHVSFDEYATNVISARKEYRRLSDMATDHHTNQILSQEAGALSGILFANIMNTLDRIVMHSRNVAKLEKKPLFRLKPEKLDRPAQNGHFVEQANHHLSIDRKLFDVSVLDRVPADHGPVPVAPVSVPNLPEQSVDKSAESEA